MIDEIIHGNCMDVLRTIEPESVHAVITDPPYGIAYQSARRIDKEVENDKAPFVWWLPEAFRVLDDPGVLICFCRWDVQEAFKLAIEWAGFTVKAQIVWDRRDHGLGDLTGAPAPRHDVAWFATKGSWKLPGKRPHSVYTVARVAADKLIHPTEKPLPLMAQIVEAYTKKGDVVLDPFAGSGSTLLAAKQGGRHYIGIEIDAEYVEKIKQRLGESQMKLSFDMEAS